MTFLRRFSILAFGRLLSLIVLLAPVVFLALRGYNALLAKTDEVLAQSAPVVSAEASRILQRRVEVGSIAVGKLGENLSVEGLWDLVRRRDTLGTLPIVFEGITVANRPGEIAAAGGPLLATAPKVVLTVSIARLAAGDFANSISLVLLENPTVTVVRDKNGKFNVLQILPKPKPKQKPSPPFRTTVEVVGGAARFRDYASRRPAAELPSDNRFQAINANVDLTGSRQILFDVAAQAAARTVTQRRLSGPLTVVGVAGRGGSGVRPDSPSPASARFLVDLDASGADLPYWIGYFVPTNAVRIISGTGDVTVSAAAPRPPRPSDPIPGISLSVSGKVRGTEIAFPWLARHLTDTRGSFEFEGGMLSFDGGGAIIGQPVMAQGAVWNLTNSRPNMPAPKPEVAISFRAPQIPIQRALRAFLPPGQKLPPGVSIGGVASAEGTVSGAAGNIVIASRFRGLDASYPGLPAARNIQADATYASSVLGITNAVATLEGGGRLTGRAAVRIGGQDKTQNGNLLFAGRAENVDIASLSALDSLAQNKNNSLQLAGRGTVDAVGKRVGGLLTAAANVRTQGLKLGEIDFPIARARVLIADNRVVVPSARVVSEAGLVNIDGTFDKQQGIRARFAASSLDLARLTRPLGITGVRGMVTARGTIAGTVTNPEVRVEEASGLNLRYETTPKPGAGPRRFAADVILARNIRLTRDSLTILQASPVVVRRYPAVAYIYGKITDLLPPPGKPRTTQPRLQVAARVQRLDISEIQDQLSEDAIAPLAKAARLMRRTIAGATRRAVNDGSVSFAPRPVSGTIADATLRISGPVDSLKVSGIASIGQALVGDYPLDGGDIRFTYADGAATLVSFRLGARIGDVTGTAALSATGALSGTFNATELDISRLSYLTEKYAVISGKVAISGVVRGTTTRPEVDIDVAPSDITVAGTQLTGLTVTDLRYRGGPRGEGSISLGSLRVQAGPGTIEIADTSYNLATNRIKASASVTDADISRLLNSLRRSGIRNTPGGAAFIRSLDKLPYPVDGRFSLTGVAVDGQLQNEKFVVNNAVVNLKANAVQIGDFNANELNTRVSMAGDLITINSFTIANPEATVLARGTYDLNGDVNIAVDSNGADLDLIRTFPKLRTFPLRGRVDISLLVSGPNSRPSYTATLLGNDIAFDPPRVEEKKPSGDGDVGISAAAATKPASVQLEQREAKVVAAAQTANDAARRPPFVFSLLRATVNVSQGEDGEGTLTINDFLAERRGAQLRIEQGQIPIAFSANAASLENRPISVTANIPSLNLDVFADLFDSAIAPAGAKLKGDENVKIGGTLEANVTLGGTLLQPTLSGRLLVKDGSLELPREAGQDRDKFNPITALNIDLALAGSRINFDRFDIELGGPNRKRGNFGKMAVTGSVTVNTLADLQNLLKVNAPADQADGTLAAAAAARVAQARPNYNAGGIRGNWDLRVKLDNLQPVEENLFGLGEAFKATLNGELSITKTLLTPTIASVDGPIRVDKAEFRIPVRAGKEAQEASPPPLFNPNFDIAVSVPSKAVIAGGSTYRFEAVGEASVRGELYDPSVQTVTRSGRVLSGGFNPRAVADLTTVGGFFQFPTARFRVEKGGGISLNYDPTSPQSGVRARDVTARARIYVPAGVNLNNYAGGDRGGFGTTSTRNQGTLGFSQPSALTPTRSYDITITLNGPLNLLQSDTLTPGRGGRNDNLALTFTSNPPLQEPQIIALIGTQAQIDLAQRGQVQDAAKQLFNQVVQSAFLPQYLSPITEGIRGSLGLEEFVVDYNPDAPLQLRVVKRLPEPFNRFLVDYTRTFATQRTAGQLLPYLFSLSYEVYQLRPIGNGIQPRFQTGLSTDEQRTVTYFLRGTISY